MENIQKSNIPTSENKYIHCCPEWDYLEISIDNPEIMACLCFDDPDFEIYKDNWFSWLDKSNED
jgi:hypothetical protein